MQENKYKELKDMIEGHREVIKTIDSRSQSQHKLLQSILVLMKNYDARMLTLQNLAIQHQVTTEDDFSDRVDVHLGLRRKESGEVVEAGDVVWVRYTATFDGKQEVEDNLPLRVGSNSVVFEGALIGKGVEEKGIEFTATMKEDKGDVKFLIDILKVKVKTKDNTEGIEDDQYEGRDEGIRAGDSGEREELNAGGDQLSP